MRVAVPQRLPVDFQPALLKLLEAVYAAQQRAFSGAATSDERDHFAAPHLQINAAKHLVESEGFAQTRDRYRQTGAQRTSSQRRPIAVRIARNATESAR